MLLRVTAQPFQTEFWAGSEEGGSRGLPSVQCAERISREKENQNVNCLNINELGNRCLIE